MSSGGGSASTPKLLNDNLTSKQYLRVLDLISEGPIYGPVDQENLSSFMLNSTPVTTEDGTVNVNGVSVAWRPGSADQEPIVGFDMIEATTIVNNEVVFDTPLIRTITDTDVTRVRVNLGVSSLVEQDTKGNQKNATVVMVIETRTGSGNYSIAETVTITGKISGEYLEAYTIDAPETKPFDLRVRRITADSESDLLQNGTIWNSYTEITDDSLSYPYSAIAGAVVDRSQYTDTPTRTFHLRGLIVDVPDNYDPIARTYDGIWTGGFKSAWTNNPAWILRALVKNDRFGLAHSAGNIDVDDGSLYVLSQFADGEVLDGYGGYETRLTLNAYITEQYSARDIIDNIAGMFRGMVLWDGMQLSVMIDNPQDPIMPISNANVVDGKFSYSSTPLSERYNAVVVSWTNPDNGWEQDKMYVSDDEQIALHGYKETTLEAFGCTSKGQAFRAGKWLIETAKREYKKVSFQMARDAIGFMPGDIVEVMDNRHVGGRLGGRIVSHSSNKIIVDSEISEVAGVNDSISIIGREGVLVKYIIREVSGNEITLQSIPDYVHDGTVFVISTSAVSTRLFRIMSVKEDSNNSTYTISAALHDPNKQAIVDEGAIFETPTDTLNGFRVPNITNLRVINVASETVQVRASWETVTTTRGLTFALFVYNENGEIVTQHTTDQFSYDFFGLNSGSYMLGVRGINDSGMKGAETQVSLIIGAPSAPSSVQWVEGIFSASLIPVMQVTATSDTSFEFWDAGTSPITNINDVEDNAQFLGRSTQWILNGLLADTTYYVYVRTRNAFGVSEFIEASGKASADIPGMIDYIDEAVRESGAFQNLQSDINTSISTLFEIDLAIGDVSFQQWEQYGAVKAEIMVVTTTIATVDQALAELAILVSAQYEEHSASITEVMKAATTANESIAELGTLVESEFESQSAQIAEVQTATANAQEAVSALETQVIASNDDITAALNQKLDSWVTLSGTGAAYYTLQLGIIRNNVTYSAGMAMGIEASGSSYRSTIVFAADQFGIYAGSDPSSWKAAFFVYNGQVFIQSAFIQDASIDFAKITDTLQSVNFVSGSAGWRILKNGNAEFNNVTVRGTVYATAGEFTGKITATSGKFTGEVEATSFIGDVANGYVFADTSMTAGNTDTTRSFRYTDSATGNLDKQVLVMCMIDSYMPSQPGTARVTITIAGVSKQYVVQLSNQGVSAYSTTDCSAVIFTVRTTARIVDCSITARSESGGVSIKAPTMLIMRGSGSFTQL